MSEQVTHLAVADDSRLLAISSPRICGPVKKALIERQDRMRLGAVTRGSERFAGPVIKLLRERREDPEPRDTDKLAFCLGTLAHRAADRMMKPIFRSQGADDEQSPRDVSVYHDVFLFDRLYGRGEKEPYNPDALSPSLPFPGAPGLEVEALESYFRVLFQRALLSAHTFKPDLSDAEAWLDRLFAKLQEMKVDVRRYHKALTDPDEEIVRRAMDEVNFYDERDAIIALLAELRSGREVAGDEFLRRYRLGDKDSLYARAVSMAYGYMQVASDFWEGRAGEELFLDAIRR